MKKKPNYLREGLALCTIARAKGRIPKSMRNNYLTMAKKLLRESGYSPKPGTKARILYNCVQNRDW